jgi:hypothetical protein
VILNPHEMIGMPTIVTARVAPAHDRVRHPGERSTS